MPLQTQPPTTHSLSGSFPPSTAGQSAMPWNDLHVLYGCKYWCPFQQGKTFFLQVTPSKLKSRLWEEAGKAPEQVEQAHGKLLTLQ